jgi:hypothetical protein
MAYQITKTREFFGPSKARSIVADEMGAPLEFTTRRDALSWIDQRDGAVYHLSHNESARPTYRVKKA